MALAHDAGIDESGNDHQQGEAEEDSADGFTGGGVGVEDEADEVCQPEKAGRPEEEVIAKSAANETLAR